MYARGGIRVVLMDALLFGFLVCLVSQAWAMPVASKRNATISLADTALYQMNRLAQSALDLTLYGLDNRSLTYDRGSCTLEKLRVRPDWRALSHRERRAYIDSILCLQRLPPQTPSAVAAGAKTRYDDFLATHINQTWQIHRTVSVACQNDIRNE
jgi:tyrosinase